MYKIYVDKSLITFSNDNSHIGEGDTVITDDMASENVPDGFSFTKLLEKLRNTKQLHIISPKIEQIFGYSLSSAPLIEAAGGLVINDQKEVLMIYRLGKWDLPKGKLEKGEDIKECAVREIGEECGIDGGSIDGFLTNTYHVYYINGQPVLKRTYWYKIKYDGDKTLTPQREEDITGAEWVSLQDVPQKLQNSYETIRDVFHTAGLV